MRKRIHITFHIVTFFFILTVNINAYGTNTKASERTSFKCKETVSFARHLLEMMSIDTKVQNGKRIWYYNPEKLSEDERLSLSNLKKLDDLAKKYNSYIDLNRHGITIGEDEYQNLRAHDSVLKNGLTAIENYLEGINGHRTPSCFCCLINTGYSFNIKNTDLCKKLIENEVRSKNQIKKIGKHNETEHVKLIDDFCVLISSMYVEKVQFKDITTSISNLADKKEEDLLPNDQRSQDRIKRIKEELERGKAGTSQKHGEPKLLREKEPTEKIELLESGGEKIDE